MLPTESLKRRAKRPAARTRIESPLKRLADRVAQAQDRDGSAAPKYRILHDVLLEAIESGTWKPGERLPSEADIVGALPFSLGTVQRALQTLVEQGVVTRRHGQGSFVAGLPVKANEIRNFRFLDDDGKNLLPVYGRMLSVDLSEDRGPWSDFLGAGEPFVRISRLINVNLEFHTFSQVFLPHRKFAELLEMPPSKISASLTHMLSERFNAPTLHVTHTVCAEPLPDEASIAIGQEAGTMGLRWELFSYTYRNLPSFYQRVYLPLTSRRLQFSDKR